MNSFFDKNGRTMAADRSGNQTNYKIAIHGNQNTFNLPEAVIAAVKRSPYFRDLYALKTFNEVVDEIYNTVSYVEPWVSGKGLGTASSAFCLLYKLFLMRLSYKQMKVLLNHTDSPYIRAIGFLYLRYGLNPKELWSWFEDYIEDPEEFAPKAASSAKQITIGRFVRDLLRDMRYFDIMLPRIPVTATREIERALEPYAAELKQQDEERRRPRDRSASPPRRRNDEYRKRRRSRSRSRDRYARHDRRDDRSFRDSRNRRDRRGHRRSRSPRRRHRDRSLSWERRRSRSNSPPRSTERDGEKKSSPLTEEGRQRMEAVRARYGASGSASVSLGSSYGSAKTSGIVEKDVVLKTEVPKAVLQYQQRRHR
mmetsp:Transcript_6353/g.19201  ORF Transcript_6353/g.19201 Transcript_6353/m.19201 type:complete len:367 (-) Transcript_6353:126-1226(-)